jgi:hypothetical protein
MAAANTVARVACKPEAPRAVEATDATARDFNTFDNMDIRGTIGRSGQRRSGHQAGLRLQYRGDGAARAVTGPCIASGTSTFPEQPVLY